jgi:hypothetical protein
MLAGILVPMLSAAAAERPSFRTDEMRGGERLIAVSRADAPAELKLVGDWDVLVSVSKPRLLAATVHVNPPQIVAVLAEKYDSLPQFNANTGG